jgi:Fe-S cluster assembly ATP-binding protein
MHTNEQQFLLENISLRAGEQVRAAEVSLRVGKGEVVFLMGQNGSGKSSLVNAVAGHPAYEITQGVIMIDGEDVTHAKADEKSRKGLFLSMQQQIAIPGITVSGMLRAAISAHRGTPVPPLDFHKLLVQKMGVLGIDPSFANRPIGTGFSGGEKKRLEMLQLLMLAPKYAMLDETDAGLDADAIRVVGETIAQLRATTGFLVITHSTALLSSLIPDRVYVMGAGKIVREGGVELAEKIAKEGYGFLHGDASAL